MKYLLRCRCLLEVECVLLFFFVIFTAFIVIKSKDSMAVSCVNGKMVNGSLFYRALESVSIASALSAALTIYPCQIQVHQ